MLKYNEGKKYIRLINLTTGVQVNKIELGSEDRIVGYNEILKMGEEYLLVGAFVDKNNPTKIGQALMRIKKDGSLVSEKYVGLIEEALNKSEDANTKNKLRDKVLLSREVVKINNSIFIMGDLYESKNFGKLIGNYNVTDMVIIQLDDNLALKDLRIIKNKSDDNSRTRFLFANVNDAQKSFTAVYGNDREENKDFYIGSETYKAGKFVTGDIKVYSKPSDYLILQAKPGHVMLFEYFKKEKRVNIRLEKF